MKKLILVLNNEVKPFGKVLNAIGHMMLGAGPRFPKNKFPLIDIYSASPTLVRHFRALSYTLNTQLTNEKSIFSDFSHTTTDGSAKDHEVQTSLIKEEDINYFSACICAEETELTAIQSFIASKDFLLLKPTKPDLVTDDFSFLEGIIYPELPDFTIEQKKVSIALAKSTTPDAIQAVTKATINLASNIVDRKILRLHAYSDADGTIHPGMSEYGLVALDAKTVKRLNTLQADIASAELASSGEYRDEAGQLMAVSLFGETAVVNGLTKKGMQLWKGDLAPSPLQMKSIFESSSPSPSSSSSNTLITAPGNS